jgi:hypothetical protein
MGNAIYDSARRELLAAQLNWNTVDLLLVAWGGESDFDPLDETLTQLKGRGAVEMGSSLPINNTSITMNGAAQTDPVVIPDIPVGPPVTWFTLCRKNPTHDLSQPLLFIDDVYQMPFYPNGLDMVIQPDWLQWRGWFLP